MTTQRSRRWLAVALVAATLCADRAMAVPAHRPQITDAARQIASRLSRSFRQTVPVARLDRQAHVTIIASLLPARLPDSQIPASCRLDSLPLLPIPPPMA